MILLTGCKQGVTREIKTDTLYNKIDINEAMNLIEKKFETMVDGTLLKMCFDETDEINKQLDGSGIYVYLTVKTNDDPPENLKANTTYDSFYCNLEMNNSGNCKIVASGM